MITNRNSTISIKKNSYSAEENPYQLPGNESNCTSPLRSHGQQSVLLNYNPITRTYFKCSIYSPSNRLYTVDEVNSNFSGDQGLCSSNNTTFHNKKFLQSSCKLESYQGRDDELFKRVKNSINAFSAESPQRRSLSSCNSAEIIDSGS